MTCTYACVFEFEFERVEGVVNARDSEDDRRDRECVNSWWSVRVRYDIIHSFKIAKV